MKRKGKGQRENEGGCYIKRDRIKGRKKVEEREKVKQGVKKKLEMRQR